MNIVLSDRVATALKTMGRDDRDRVSTWFDYLKNWEEDPFVKSHSVPLTVQGRSVYLFRTSTDIRIFYTVDEEKKTILIVDIAQRQTILTSGAVTGGGV